VRAEAPHFFNNCRNHLSRRKFTMAVQGFDQPPFSKLLLVFVERFRNAIRVNHQRISGKKLTLFHSAIPVRK